MGVSKSRMPKICKQIMLLINQHRLMRMLNLKANTMMISKVKVIKISKPKKRIKNGIIKSFAVERESTRVLSCKTLKTKASFLTLQNIERPIRALRKLV